MPERKMKISTWNLCLGLSNKKNIVKNYILGESIDICCMQEVDIPRDYPNELLSFPGYNIEVETNETKSRVATYIKDNIKYIVNKNLEGTNSNLQIIDIDQTPKLRIINIYRSFNPQGGVTQREKFKYQLQLIKEAMTENIIIIGDFNIDDGKRLDTNYACYNYFNDVDEIFAEYNLMQLIDFATWSRVVNNVIKESTLDHLYVRDSTIVSNLKSCKPCFGDHLLITFEVCTKAQGQTELQKRDWRNYSKIALCEKLEEVDWDIGADTVQACWNIFENKLINVIDSLVPYTTFTNNRIKQISNPPHVKNWLNVRHRLLKNFNRTKNISIKTQIRSLDQKIRAYFREKRKNEIRKSLRPGDSKSLWKAVRVAKDLNPESIPPNLTHLSTPIPPTLIPDAFADIFDKKVNDIHNESIIDPLIYNGKRKINAVNKFFMSESDIMDCIKTIKIKNCEGIDRIPQRILVDGASHLVAPLSLLFKMIYYKKEIPKQWLMAKVTPIHKKGSKHEISNYRPISNLCSTSKIFEKLIQKRIGEIEIDCDIDITGKEQHGFKKSKSTATAGLIIQSLIARALDRGEYSIMASVDLTAAFDVVNIELLIRRLKIVGLPDDVVSLVEIWLKNRSYYVTVNGEVSMLRLLLCGVVQGSILGPLLYALYVSPLFDLIKLTNFADDNFVVRWNRQIEELISATERDLEIMIGWLRGSGLKVNEIKTEICLFHKTDVRQITVTLNNCPIQSQNKMNVLGVLFDTKLTWIPQINQTISKANSALHAIRLIKKHFSAMETKQMITANFFSVLYYNSEIWQLPSLPPQAKQKLLSASANALKLCTPNYSREMSFQTIHNLNARASPDQMTKYKLAIQLHKTFNLKQPPLDWLSLNDEISTNSRQNFFETISITNNKIGNNFLSNRFKILNKQIPLSWLNASISTFKINCKEKFLKR